MSEISKLAKMLVSILKEKDANKASPYDTKATVKRVEGGTAWVHIPGGVDETPVQLTIDAKEDDSVQVRVSGGKAWLTGNNTAPPTDDAEAYKARDAAKKADIKAGKAGDAAAEADKVAKEAKKIAGDTEQHFWFTETGSDTGAHITEIPQEEWEDSSSPNYHSGGNLLARSNGIAIREGMNELATFGASGVVIGQDANNKTRSELTASGMDIISKSNLGNDVQIAHLGYKSVDRVPYFTFGSRLSGTIGSWSFAEGNSNIASGLCSHSEGSGNESSGKYSHSEGLFTEASGDYSHASGEHIQATRRSQTVIGEWNDPDTGGTDETTRGDFAFIVGNGSAGDGRSNAMTVDWNGGIENYMDYNVFGTGSDYPLYQAIKKLGWDSDVIDYPMMNLKTLLTKILQRLNNIGKVYGGATGTKTVNITSTNTDTYVEGGTTGDLEPGTYIVTMHVSFQNNSAEAIRRIQLYNKTASSVIVTCSDWDRYWTAHSYSWPVQVTETTNLAVRVSAGVTMSDVTTNIRATRIS